jgi:hypothetical protein
VVKNISEDTLFVLLNENEGNAGLNDCKVMNERLVLCAIKNEGMETSYIYNRYCLYSQHLQGLPLTTYCSVES